MFSLPLVHNLPDRVQPTLSSCLKGVLKVNNVLSVDALMAANSILWSTKTSEVGIEEKKLSRTSSYTDFGLNTKE